MIAVGAGEGAIPYHVNMFGQVEKIDRRLAWMKKLKMSNVGPNERICSLHFCKDNYKLIGILVLL